MLAKHLHLKCVKLFDRYWTNTFSVVSRAHPMLRYALVPHVDRIKLCQKGTFLFWSLSYLVIDVSAVESFMGLWAEIWSELLHRNFFHMVGNVTTTESRVVVHLMKIKPDTPLRLIQRHIVWRFGILIPVPLMCHWFCHLCIICLPNLLHMFWSVHAATHFGLNPDSFLVTLAIVCLWSWSRSGICAIHDLCILLRNL